MITLPDVPLMREMSNEELRSYLFRLVEAARLCLNELDARVKKLEENNG